MPVLALTDRFVGHAKPGPEYFDDTVKGLALRVSAGGHKLDFPFHDGGKRAHVTLGSYPATGLAKARTLATEARGHVEEGRDPRRVLKAADAAAQMTVADLIGSYLEKHVRPNLRSAHHMELRLAANVTPVIGDIRLADLHRRDVNRVLDPIVARKRQRKPGWCFKTFAPCCAGPSLAAISTATPWKASRRAPKRRVSASCPTTKCGRSGMACPRLWRSPRHAR